MPRTEAERGEGAAAPDGGTRLSRVRERNARGSMNEAAAAEDYETAALLRDELRKWSKENDPPLSRTERIGIWFERTPRRDKDFCSGAVMDRRESVHNLNGALPCGAGRGR